MPLISPELFLQVRRPARYIGGEYNQIKKQWSPDLVTFALAFPDLYEIGMSHLGSRIIYHILNDLSYAVCERVFAPWIDMEELLRKKNISLFSLENRKPLKEFDILGFSIGYELSYTNVLNMLGLSDIEIYSNKRKHGPIVIAGGLGAFSPEPMAPFIDLFVIGDGEEVVVEIVKAFHNFKSQKMTRYEKLQALNRISGVYAPEFHAPSSRIKKRVVKDLDKSPYPIRMIVPYMEVVHDRYALEIMRGCSRGCRFCQAGFLYRPVRERSMEKLLELAAEGIKRTGYEEVSFLSLSSGDYSKLPELLKSFNTSQLSITSVSLPSLHIENITPEIVSYLKTIRKNTFTFAPETGEKRVSFAINKKFDYNKLLEMSEHLFKIGYRKIKLYFMIGLPREGEKVVEEMVNLVSEIACRRPASAPHTKNFGRGADITVSVSNFIPKPHTPFQWEKMEDLSSLWNKQMKLKELFKKMKRVKFNYHDLNSSFLEAVLSRGDRKLSSVIYEAWKSGAKFDSWRECFRYSAWQDAFKKTDIDPYFYSHRERDEDELLPWDHIDTGIDKDFFRAERKKAGEGVESPDCRSQCLNCGVCSKNILTSGKS